MGNVKRRQLFVDKTVQGALVKRAVIYWCLSMITIVLTLLVWRAFTGPARQFYTHFDDIWFHNGTVFVILAMFLPLFLADTIKTSNRFCGPAMRLRKALHNLAYGKPAATLKFRDSDYWQSFADDFNVLLKRVEQLEREAAEAQTSGSKQNPSLVSFQVTANQEETIEDLDPESTVAENTVVENTVVENTVVENTVVENTVNENIAITEGLSTSTTGNAEQSV